MWNDVNGNHLPDYISEKVEYERTKYNRWWQLEFPQPHEGIGGGCAPETIDWVGVWVIHIPYTVTATTKPPPCLCWLENGHFAERLTMMVVWCCRTPHFRHSCPWTLHFIVRFLELGSAQPVSQNFKGSKHVWYIARMSMYFQMLLRAIVPVLPSGLAPAKHNPS